MVSADRPVIVHTKHRYLLAHCKLFVVNRLRRTKADITIRRPREQYNQPVHGTVGAKGNIIFKNQANIFILIVYRFTL